nr:1630_t:CDS:1 [Entrophospora candida]CAG8607798.1 14080_t:CDS:1 [Entrophospora candida]
MSGETEKKMPVPTELLKMLHDQRLKLKIRMLPQYEFGSLENNHYCTVKYDDQSWTSGTFRTKREAKNDASQMALNELQKKYKEEVTCVMRLASENLKRQPRKQIFGNNIRSISKELHWSEMIPAVKQWFSGEKFRMLPSILLNELALRYQLGQPNYVCLTFPKGVQNDFKYGQYIAVDIGRRRFNPSVISNDFNIAKDHVAHIAFRILYEEIMNIEMKIIIQKDFDYKKSIGIVMLKEDIKTVPPIKCYKNVINNIGLPIEEQAEINDLMNKTPGPKQAVQCPLPAVPSAQYPSPAVPSAQYPSPAVPSAQYPSPAVPSVQYSSPAVPSVQYSSPAQYPSPAVPSAQYPSPAVPFAQYHSPVLSAPFPSGGSSFVPFPHSAFLHNPGSAPTTTNPSLQNKDPKKNPKNQMKDLMENRKENPIKNRKKNQKKKFKNNPKKNPIENPMKKDPTKDPMGNLSLHSNKTFTSLIYELAAKKSWPIPQYVYHKKVDGDGFCAILSINDRHFKGLFHPTKKEAKEGISQLAFWSLV